MLCMCTYSYIHTYVCLCTYVAMCGIMVIATHVSTATSYNTYRIEMTCEMRQYVKLLYVHTYIVSIFYIHSQCNDMNFSPSLTLTVGLSNYHGSVHYCDT